MKRRAVAVETCSIPKVLHATRKKSKRIKARLGISQSKPSLSHLGKVNKNNPNNKTKKKTRTKLSNRVVKEIPKPSKLLVKKNCHVKTARNSELATEASLESIPKPITNETSTSDLFSKDPTVVITPLQDQKASSVLLTNTTNLIRYNTLFDGMSNVSPTKNTSKLPDTPLLSSTISTAITSVLSTDPAKQSCNFKFNVLSVVDNRINTPKSIIDVLDSMGVNDENVKHDTEKTAECLNEKSRNVMNDNIDKDITTNQQLCESEMVISEFSSDEKEGQHEVSENGSDSSYIRDLLMCNEVLETYKNYENETTITTSCVLKEEVLPEVVKLSHFIDNANYMEMLNVDSIDLELTTPVQNTVILSSENDENIQSQDMTLENVVPLSSGTNDIISPNAPMSANISSMFAQKKTTGTSTTVETPELTRVRVAESLLLLSEHDTNCTFCVSCKKAVAGTCQLHGNPMSLLAKTKAVLSLPPSMSIQESFLLNAGLGVFSLSVFEVGSLFGPMEGEKLTLEEDSSRTNNAYVWKVYRNDRMAVAHYLDCVDEEKSNWLRFVNCARFEEEQNLIAEQYDELVFYKAYKKILPGDELLVWYGGNQMETTKVTHVNNELENKVTEFSSVKIEEREIFQCPMCKALFSCEYYLKRHRTYVCPASSEFRCDVCSKLFKNMGNYKRHKKKGCNAQKAFKCIICGATLTQKANLKVHLRTHLNIRDFKCQHCERSFSRATFLRNHVLAVHEKEKPFICNTCGREFSRMDSMKRHKLTHNERSTICLFCGSAYPSLNALGCHVARKHRNNPEMLEDKCRICHETFLDIKTHMLNVHEKKAMVECHICKLSFRNITNHMKTHSREESQKKETCLVCNENFRSLSGHMKKHTMHTKLLKQGKITVEKIEKKEIEEKKTGTDSKKNLKGKKSD